MVSNMPSSDTGLTPYEITWHPLPSQPPGRLLNHAFHGARFGTEKLHFPASATIPSLLIIFCKPFEGWVRRLTAKGCRCVVAVLCIDVLGAYLKGVELYAIPFPSGQFCYM